MQGILRVLSDSHSRALARSCRAPRCESVRCAKSESAAVARGRHHEECSDGPIAAKLPQSLGQKRLVSSQGQLAAAILVCVRAREARPQRAAPVVERHARSKLTVPSIGQVDVAAQIGPRKQLTQTRADSIRIEVQQRRDNAIQRPALDPHLTTHRLASGVRSQPECKPPQLLRSAPRTRRSIRFSRPHGARHRRSWIRLSSEARPVRESAPVRVASLLTARVERFVSGRRAQE